MVGVYTDQGNIYAKKVVITTGGATSKFLNLPTEATPQSVHYFEIPSAHHDTMPMIIYHDNLSDEIPHGFYALPENNLMKFGFHIVDSQSKIPSLPNINQTLSNFFGQMRPHSLPNKPPEIKRVMGCSYTVTPDKKPIIGPMKAYNNQVIVKE